MATIYNSDLSKELTLGAKIQTGRDAIPNQLAEKVVPVMEVNPKLLRRATQLANLLGRTTTATGVTVMSAKTNQDVFITGLLVSNVQSAASDNVLIAITTTMDGAAKVIYRRVKATLTASNTHDYMEFNIPLKIDRGAAITFTLAFTAGTSTTDVIVFGYLDENPLS